MGTRELNSTQINLTISTTVRNVISTASIASGGLSIQENITVANGVSASQANRAWKHEATLSSGASQTIDLFDYAGIDAGAGAGNDIVGQSLEVKEIVTIHIKNKNTVGVAGSLEVQADATNPFNGLGEHTVANGGALKGGGFLLKHQPDTDAFQIIDGSQHRIKLTANGADVDYSILLLGRHDDDESSSSSSVSSSSSSSVSSSSSSSSSVSSSSQSSSS